MKDARRKELYAAYEEASRDPAFLADMYESSHAVIGARAKRFVRRRIKTGSVWRLRIGLALLIAVPLWIILATGCASPRGVPGYDGDLIPQSDALPDSIRVTILNERTIDAQPPRIYLDGMGRHDLGIIPSINGRISRLIAASWFGPTGCITIRAHFVGSGDLVFSETCWRPGDVVEATLLNDFDPQTAWSHRK